MSCVVNNHLSDLSVLSNKEKNPKLINVGPTSIPESRVSTVESMVDVTLS